MFPRLSQLTTCPWPSWTFKSAVVWSGECWIPLSTCRRHDTSEWIHIRHLIQIYGWNWANEPTTIYGQGDDGEEKKNEEAEYDPNLCQDDFTQAETPTASEMILLPNSQLLGRPEICFSYTFFSIARRNRFSKLILSRGHYCVKLNTVRLEPVPNYRSQNINVLSTRPRNLLTNRISSNVKSFLYWNSEINI